MRTVLSVVGHTMCAVVTHHICRRDLAVQCAEDECSEQNINVVAEKEGLLPTNETNIDEHP